MFAPELGGLDRDQVRDWYNGYSWRGADKVYNPIDILLLFDTREFAAHWFETGTPTFLVDTLFRRRVFACFPNWPVFECAGTRRLAGRFPGPASDVVAGRLGRFPAVVFRRSRR